MRLKRVPYYLLRLVPVLLFLTVFILMDGLMNPWGISKVLYIICLASAGSLVLAAALLAQKERSRLELSLVDSFALLFTIYLLVRGLFTKRFSPDNPSFIGVFALAFLYFLLAGILRRAFRKSFSKSILVTILFRCFLLVGLFQAIYGLLQLYGIFPGRNPYFNVTGSFGNPDFLGGYLAVVIPVAVGFYLYGNDNRVPRDMKVLGAVTFIVCLLALAATHDRGAWLAALAGTGFITACRFQIPVRFAKILNTAAKRIACGLAGLCLLGVLGTGLYMLKPDSAYGRLFIWKITFERIVPENPAFGIGFSRFYAGYNNKQAAYFASGAGTPLQKRVAGNVHQAHNEYLQILAELGIVGLLLFGGIIAGLLVNPNQWLKGRGQNAWLRQIGLASLLAAAVAAFFRFPFIFCQRLQTLCF